MSKHPKCPPSPLPNDCWGRRSSDRHFGRVDTPSPRRYPYQITWPTKLRYWRRVVLFRVMKRSDTVRLGGIGHQQSATGVATAEWAPSCREIIGTGIRTYPSGESENRWTPANCCGSLTRSTAIRTSTRRSSSRVSRPRWFPLPRSTTAKTKRF